MAIKRNASAGRMLRVFELVSRMQPVGVSALARELGADKSAIQRDLLTLGDAGWLRPAAGSRGQWELTLHVLSVARAPHSSNALRLRMRPLLERVHAATAETVYLALPHVDRFVVFDAIESTHILRVVPPVGVSVPLQGSATARAYLACLDPAAQTAMLGHAPDAAMLRDIAAARAEGYAVSDGEVEPGSVAIAAPVLDAEGRPLGAIVVVGQRERLVPERWQAVGRMLGSVGRLASNAWEASALPHLSRGAAGAM